MPKLDGKHYKYTTKGKLEYLKDKKKKKKKVKKGRNGDDYGQIPTGGGPENPVGGN